MHLESITRAWLIESMNTDKWSLQVIEHNGKTIDFLFQESKPLQWGKKRKTYIPESKIPIPSRSNYDAAIQVPEAECDTNQKWIVERYEKDTYFYNALLLSMSSLDISQNYIKSAATHEEYQTTLKQKQAQNFRKFKSRQWSWFF